MGVSEFSETVACFMRVAWAAGAGRLHLAASSQPIKDSGVMANAYSTGNSRSRQSSTGTSRGSLSVLILNVMGLTLILRKRFVRYV